MRARFVIAATAVALFAGASRLSAQQATETPAQLYGRSCAACHGATGVPAPAMARSMGIPDFTGAGGVAAQPDSVLQTAIRAGKGKMPAYGTRLSADQIRQLVTYIKSLRR